MASTINFTFADRKGKKAPRVTWYDGDRVPDLTKIKGVEADFFAVEEDGRGRKRQKNTSGTFIIGTKGTIWTDTYSSSIRVYPDDFFQEVKSSGGLPPKTLDRVRGGPFKEFTDSIKAGKKAGSDFSYAADFTETALLGLVAIQAGTKIKYNAKKMQVTNNKEANKYLTSQYDYKSGFIPS